MGKFILLLSLLGISILFCFGLIYPASPVMWLSSTSVGYTFLRLIMMVMLIALLATNPPRNAILRMLVGSFAMAIGLWASWGFYFYSVMPMDLLSILMFSISSGLAVLESKKIPLEALSIEDRIAKARNSRMAAYSQFELNHKAS